LFINKRNKTEKIVLPASFKGGKLTVVDVTTGDNEPVQSTINTNTIELKPFAVAVLSL